MNAQELIARYLQLRDYVAKRSAEHAEELAPYVAGMTTIENQVSALLIAQAGGDEGKSNIATPAGTAYRKRWTSMKIADRPTFFQFIYDGWSDRQKFLTAAVAKKEVEEYIEVEKAVPPGLDISRGYATYFNSPKS
jgi:hypothetical protein